MYNDKKTLGLKKKLFYNFYSMGSSGNFTVCWSEIAFLIILLPTRGDGYINFTYEIVGPNS